MQQNNIRLPQNDRGNNLNVPTHGRMPRWLTDMSSKVERNHTQQLTKNYFPPNYETISNNNDKFSSYSTSSLEPHIETSSTPNSAKHGRRSSQSQYQLLSPFKKKLNMDTYIVPKIDEINFNLFNHQTQRVKPNYRNDGTQSTSSLDNYIEKGVTTQENYNPSILEQQSGRKSRADQIDQLSSGLKDYSFNETSTSSTSVTETHYQHDVNTKSFNVHLNLKDNISFKMNLHIDPQVQVNKFEQKSPTNEFESMKQFEEDFLILKHKIQQRRKRYKSFKKSKSFLNEHSFQTKSGGDNNLNYDPHETFIIPELPTGTIMILDILSTWGDKYYVGLNGIELFDSDGNIVAVRKISACPEDINVLPNCIGDPRVVTNLLDGVNRTQDDSHLWLTPFDPGEHHLITVEFMKKTELAMIRIWNYNKSRIHSSRGAKHVLITLDGKYIFRGEIAQACGSILGRLDTFGDTILFTTDNTILEKISVNDISFSTLMSELEKSIPDKVERPSTATERDDLTKNSNEQQDDVNSESSEHLFGIHRLDIVFILNWGKNEYIGLTGLELIGDSDQKIALTADNLQSNNLSTSAMLSRLIDNENITIDRKHMWYTQYNINEEIVITVLFKNLTYIAGIRIWNYNENLEMSFCGARMIKILLDNKLIINPLTNDSTFLVRRAPGNIHYDFVQEIIFCRNNLLQIQPEPFYDLNNLSSAHKEELFENPIMPEGFVFQIVIYTTWGDQYYVGLNGLEMFDQHGKKIILTESNICAHPESVNVLPGVSGDVRTPDKLVDGINEQSDGAHSWLVPIIPKCLNRIYIVFDQPIIISVMKIWNYIKTPTRGVKEFGILVDDLLIYNGILDKIHDKSSVKYRTILFTNNKNVAQKEMASLVKHSIDSQATILTNDEPRVTTGGSLPNADQSLRPFTSVNYLKRERTSQSQ